MTVRLKRQSVEMLLLPISSGLLVTLGMLKLVTQHKLPAEKFGSHEFSFDQMLEAHDVFASAVKRGALKVLIH